MDKLLLTPSEAGEVLGVGRSTVYDLMRFRLLVSVKIGRRRLVPMKACLDLVDRLIEQESDAA